VGLVGATFFFAPAIQYQWAFALGGAAIVMGLISFNQPGGKNLATWGILLGGLAIVAGIMGYQQVQEAVEGLEGPGRQECLEYAIETRSSSGFGRVRALKTRRRLAKHGHTNGHGLLRTRVD
jgi:hypothetical protein